jgi:hypothetical protein
MSKPIRLLICRENNSPQIKMPGHCRAFLDQARISSDSADHCHNDKRRNDEEENRACAPQDERCLG